MRALLFDVAAGLILTACDLAATTDRFGSVESQTEAGKKAVFGVEYSGSTNSFCPQANALDFDWLKKRLDLTAWRVACR